MDPQTAFSAPTRRPAALKYYTQGGPILGRLVLAGDAALKIRRAIRAFAVGLWLVLQPRPTLLAIGAVLGIGLVVMAVNAYVASLTRAELPVILLQATDRAVA